MQSLLKKKGRLRCGGFAEKEERNERVRGDGILIIISMNVSSHCDHIRFYS